tara:strand:+ start:4581 stop:6056 length:1476 start_codon:yes stop_codon:yes gene_type:complete
MGYFNANDPLGQFSLVPTPKKMLTSTSYLDFTNGTSDFAQQYLPEIYEAEVERYGNRTIGGFLRMVGAEMPMTSDQVIWSEQNRLHIAFVGASIANVAGEEVITGLAGQDSAGNAIIPAIRPGQTIVVTNNTSLISTKCYVKNAPVADGAGKWQVTAASYDLADLQTLNGAGEINVFVYGSEFAKGTKEMEGSIEPSFTQYNNSPVIIKDKYEINGSDTAQIGWVEVATEDGTSGYLWYLKAESETRLRFQDYLEMVMIEGEKAVGAAAAVVLNDSTQTVKGTEGLFAAIEGRGNVYDNYASGLDGAAAPRTALQDFDLILQNLDKQGAIEENMLFLNRATALSFDDMLAVQNSYGAGGTSYGVFENSAEMALNLGFSGFRRGSYDFYKTDWKYLNDATTGGLNETVDGVLVPAGTSTVYDQMLGANIRRPFLHVRYRASEADDRRMKTWLTGSVGGAFTTGDDVMKVHFLSERCLVTQAANNFVIFKSVA